MTRSRADNSKAPRPIPVRRYRYSKLRWRIGVRALDAVGSCLTWCWRRFRARPKVESPRRILVAQLDHLGDAVLSSPLFPKLQNAYPDATIDVLASPSNRAIFEADPRVDRVIVAERSWFERRPGRKATATAVWELGKSLRARRYDLGIDVRGDVLTVLVLALARIPRRLGWAMGGGGFLLTDVAPWVPDRHEVVARLALLEPLGIVANDTEEPPRVVVHLCDRDRARIAKLLRDAWPSAPHAGYFFNDFRSHGSSPQTQIEGRRQWKVSASRASGNASKTLAAARRLSQTDDSDSDSDDPEILHAGRFGDDAPLLAAHLGAGTPAKRWPSRHWRDLIGRFLAEGWRVAIVGGSEDLNIVEGLPPHPNLRDWTGRLAVTETAALLERADLFIGADSAPAHLAACAGTPSVVLFSGTNRVRQWRPWSRRSLVLKRRVSCSPCHRKVCPLADHPCLSGLSPDRVQRAARRLWMLSLRSEASGGPR